MAEPQPPTVTEGLDPSAPAAENDPDTPLPKGADSRRAAAALSSLDARTDDDSKSKTTPSAADRQALGDAMNRLEGLELGGKASTLSTSKSPEKERKEREAEERRKVKVDAGDVALVIEELELSKVKATELLKSYGGDAVRAITAYVTGVV